MKRFKHEECYWNSIEKDMGATLNHCDLHEIHDVDVTDENGECKYYISKDDVSSMVAEKFSIELKPITEL